MPGTLHRRDDMQKPLFAIGSVIGINGTDHSVVKYHKVGRRWEVMFRNLDTGSHLSITLGALEGVANAMKGMG